MDNVVTALASTFLIGSSSFLHTIRTTNKSLDDFELRQDPITCFGVSSALSILEINE